MPRDIVIANPSQNWDTLLDAVDAAYQETQSTEDTWCVVGVNGAHILTVWSKPHTAEDKWVRPSNHAEERLVMIYPETFKRGFEAMKGNRNYVSIFLKKSPCNFGTGSCYDMLRRFLLAYRSDHSDANMVEIIYGYVYGGFKGMYQESSQEAIDEFNKIRGCLMTSRHNWSQADLATPVAPITTSPSGTPSAPRPINLPSRRAERALGIAPVGEASESVLQPLARRPDQPVWVTRYLYQGEYQVILEEDYIPEQLKASIQEVMQKKKAQALRVREVDGKINAMTFDSVSGQCLLIDNLALLQK